MKYNNITRSLIVYIIVLKSVVCMAQADSVCHDNTVIPDSIQSVADNKRGILPVSPVHSSQYRFKPLQLVVPATLIGADVIGLGSGMPRMKAISSTL